MNAFESIMQGLNEALEHQEGKGKARTIKVNLRPVPDYTAEEIKEIRDGTGLSQALFALSIGVSKKTIESWECGRYKPKGSSSRMLEIAQAAPQFFRMFEDQ